MNKAIESLKAVLITLLIPAAFFLFMGPIKLAELWYPDYQWIRYAPLVLIFSPAMITVCGKKEE